MQQRPFQQKLLYSVNKAFNRLFVNVGWVNVGVDHDTAQFAVQSIRSWWKSMGRSYYKNAQKLFITADGGGSNGSRVRLWKIELQKLADELMMDISVSH